MKETVEIKENKGNNFANSIVYDTIIIGGGLGGLSAAAELASAGKKVILFEKHSSPGGFATSFVRGRFEFEGALHELNSIGTPDKPGHLYQTFEKWGIVPELKFVHPDEFYRSIFPDLDVVLPFGVDAFEKKLIQEFPENKDEIEKLISVCRKIKEGVSWVGQHGMKPIQILFKHPWVARVAGLTLNEFITKFTTNEKLIGVFTQLWCYLGPPPSNGSAILFVGMLMSYLSEGAAYPIGRSHALSSAIVNSIQEHGGEVRFNALVDKIRIENGKIRGIELINGDFYPCKTIISNVNPICTVMKMLPKKSVSDSFLKKIKSPQIGPSIFSVYLGLNTTPAELGIENYEVFINNSYDLDEIFNTSILNPKAIVTTCHNLIDPDITPKGTCQLVISALQFGSDWHNVPPSEYFKVKDEIANKLISIVEKRLIPNIRSFIEVAEVASPLTYYRYSKSLDGAIYGSMSSVYNSPITKLSNKSEIPKLFFSGAWTNEGGGFSTVVSSGRNAAHLVLNLLEEINND